MRLTNLFICGMLISFSFTPILYAATIHVPADQPTIQEGINAAVDGDTVLVAPGTYQGIGNRAVDFMGKAIVVRSSHGALQTTIDCEKMNRGLRIWRGEGSDSRFEGLTIANGSLHVNGGGIETRQSSPVISDCIIRGCDAPNGGGMLVYDNSSPIIRNCTFSMNTAVEEGGAIRGFGANIHLINSVCWNDSAGLGREISLYVGEITISYSDISFGQDSISLEEGATLNWLEGNITDNPMFADTTEGDFHLNIGSPCVDAGDSSILDSCKPPGKGRYRSDVGAYGGEFNCWASEPALGRTAVIGLQPPGKGQAPLYPTSEKE